MIAGEFWRESNEALSRAARQDRLLVSVVARVTCTLQRPGRDYQTLIAALFSHYNDEQESDEVPGLRARVLSTITEPKVPFSRQDRTRQSTYYDAASGLFVVERARVMVGLGETALENLDLQFSQNGVARVGEEPASCDVTILNRSWLARANEELAD